MNWRIEKSFSPFEQLLLFERRERRQRQRRGPREELATKAPGDDALLSLSLFSSRNIYSRVKRRGSHRFFCRRTSERTFHRPFSSSIPFFPIRERNQRLLRRFNNRERGRGDGGCRNERPLHKTPRPTICTTVRWAQEKTTPMVEDPRVLPTPSSNPLPQMLVLEEEEEEEARSRPWRRRSCTRRNSRGITRGKWCTCAARLRIGWKRYPWRQKSKRRTGTKCFRWCATYRLGTTSISLSWTESGDTTKTKRSYKTRSGT